MIKAGITNNGNEVNIVIISGDKPPFTCEAETDFHLQIGEKATAYSHISKQIEDYLRDRKVEKAVVKGSALSGQGRPTEAILFGAELRGVVQVAAINAGCNVKIIKKALLSKERSRNVDEYTNDDGFWKDNLPQLKKKGLRTAALLAVLD